MRLRSKNVLGVVDCSCVDCGSIRRSVSEISPEACGFRETRRVIFKCCSRQIEVFVDFRKQRCTTGQRSAVVFLCLLRMLRRLCSFARCICLRGFRVVVNFSDCFHRARLFCKNQRAVQWFLGSFLRFSLHRRQSCGLCEFSCNEVPHYSRAIAIIYTLYQ